MRLRRRAVDRDRLVEGFVLASLVSCVGPLTVLGSLSDGLGRGIDQLALKTTLDGFTSTAVADLLPALAVAPALTLIVSSARH